MRAGDARMRHLLQDLLNELKAVREEHEEVTDTMVRDILASVIQEQLVTGSSPVDVPTNMGMFSDEGNRLVAGALDRYLRAAVPYADELGLDEAARQRAVWDSDVADVDDFLGAVD